MTNDDMIRELFEGMIRARVLEDRREYCIEDLAHAYALSKPEATQLYNIIQDHFK